MNNTTKRILREEALRSVVPIGFGLFGWSIIISSTEQIPANALTVLGLPLLTGFIVAASLSLVRVYTGASFKAEQGGKDASLVLTLFGGFFLSIYLAVTGEGVAAIGLVAVLIAVVAIRVVRPSTFGYES